METIYEEVFEKPISFSKAQAKRLFHIELETGCCSSFNSPFDNFDRSASRVRNLGPISKIAVEVGEGVIGAVITGANGVVLGEKGKFTVTDSHELSTHIYYLGVKIRDRKSIVLNTVNLLPFMKVVDSEEGEPQEEEYYDEDDED